MDKAAKDAIRELVLDLRETLEAEVERELGRYGIYADRAWIDARDLARLSDKERDRDWPRIEAAIIREQQAGLSRVEAVQALIRETAYTHMNRLVGLKCMEVRGLIDETITTRPIYSDRSKRHRDYLEEHEQAHREPDRGLLAMLQQAYAEVSQHIGVVFDPDSDYSIVWPRHTVLKECIAAINAVDEKAANKLGDDPETTASVFADDTVLGWVYQYFQEREKNRVFAELREKRKKISGYDIIPATTAYTERYMVQFLIENSLGALWMEMYPDSDLCEAWEYFVEDPNLQNEDGTRKQGRDPRPVGELTLLDPACGSGHFLLYAFDLFARMHEIEAQMQGQAVDRVEIARRILGDNLYGIDIDLRSIQLSALNLYMKACTYARVRLDELQNRDPVQMKLVCADIVLRRGSELGELLDLFKDDPLTQDLIKTIWRGLENARELGSLLKVEEQVDKVIAHKQKVEKGTWWEHPDEAWEQWKRDFLNTLRVYVDRAAESFDVNRRMFGQEAIRGVQLLDLLTRRYDVVAMNPPYMGASRMVHEQKQVLRDLYQDSWYDLFSSFIDRASLLLANQAYLVAVAQQVLMFINSYARFRKKLCRDLRITAAAHLGSGAFDDISGEVVNTVLLCARRDLLEKPTRSVFLRAVDASDKSASIKRIAASASNPNRYTLSLKALDVLEGFPFVYWASPKIISLFQALPPFRDYAETKTGIVTTNNALFQRFGWEVQDTDPPTKWFPLMTGGVTSKWWGDGNVVINWRDNGTDIKEYVSRKYAVSRMVCAESYYFKAGITYQNLASKGLCARVMPPGYIFDKVGQAVFSTHDTDFLLGYLNSTLVTYLLDLLNPTMHSNASDIARLPLAPPPTWEPVVSKAVQWCIDWSRQRHQSQLTDREFMLTCLEATLSPGVPTPDLAGAYRQHIASLFSGWAGQLITEAFIDREINSTLGLDESTEAHIWTEQGTPPGLYPVIAGYEEIPTNLVSEVREFLDSLPHIELAPGELSVLKQRLQQLYVKEKKSIEEISKELELNPVSVIALRREMDLINPAHLKHEVENFLTHRMWELCKRDDDGIIPYDDGLQNPSLLEQVRGEIEEVFGADQAVVIEAEMDEILGRGGLARWLGNPFFRKHASQFKKRPILWQITSPDQQFRVLVYYHKLDHDTLPKIRSQYLWPLLERAKTKLRAARRHDPPDMKTIGDLEAYIADLEKCDQLLESVIEGTIDVDLPDWANGPYRDGKAPYNPDLDDGVKVNILPLQAAGLLPMKKVV